MDRLPYLDLQAQYDRTGTEVLAALREICESGRFAQGPVTSDFEGNSQRADPERDERAFCLLKKRPPLLSSDPNPVPAGQELGKTTVSWDTCDGSIGRVFVSINEGQEVLIADGRRGSAAAHWIETGSTYEFRLYNSDHTELLASVIVTRTND